MFSHDFHTTFRTPYPPTFDSHVNIPTYPRYRQTRIGILGVKFEKCRDTKTPFLRNAVSSGIPFSTAAAILHITNNHSTPSDSQRVTVAVYHPQSRPHPRLRSLRAVAPPDLAGLGPATDDDVAGRRGALARARSSMGAQNGGDEHTAHGLTSVGWSFFARVCGPELVGAGIYRLSCPPLCSAMVPSVPWCY